MGSSQSTDSNSGSFIEWLTNRSDTTIPNALNKSKQVFNKGEEADLPAECWVALLQYQSTAWLARMSMTSKRWKSQVWTFASVVDTSYIVNQHAFDSIIDQIVDACTTTPGLVALRNLILVPKRLKLATASAILPRVNKLSCLKRLTLLLCSDIGWEQLALCTELLAEIPELSLHRCSALFKMPEFEKNISKLSKIETLELNNFTEVTTAHIKVVAKAFTNLRSLTLRDVQTDSQSSQSIITILSNLSSLCHLEITQCNLVNGIPPDDIKLLANFPLLETLNLEMDHLNTLELDSCPFMPNLKELRVCSFTTKDSNIDLGSKMPNLATLIVTRRSLGLPNAINTLRSLQKLCISFNDVSNLNPTGELSGIANLELTACENFPLVAWNATSQCWPQLRRLSISSILMKDIVPIYDFISGCKQLDSLEIPYDSNASNSLKFLCNLTQLYKLSFVSNTHATKMLYHSIGPLGRSGALILSNLTSLAMNWSATPREVESISNTFKNLQFFQVYLTIRPESATFAPLLKLENLLELRLVAESAMQTSPLEFPHPTASVVWINKA